MSDGVPELRHGEITRLLGAAVDGDGRAADELLPLVYEELRHVAHARMAGLDKGMTLQATGLVHEAWLRLVKAGDPGWESRTHFFRAAARSMRNILVEQARRRGSLKREAARKQALADELPLDTSHLPVDDVLSLHEALARFEQDHERAAEVVSLRFFAGLTMPEIAELTGHSLTTVERDWRFARSWLQHALGEAFD